MYGTRRREANVSRIVFAVTMALTVATSVAGQTGLKVQIVGQIIDREEKAILVWGRALPSNGDGAAFGANVGEANLMVWGAKVTNPVMYMGDACFIGKDSALNAAG